MKRWRHNVGGIRATLTMEADTTLSVDHRGPCKGDLLSSDENINGLTGCLNFKLCIIQHFALQNLVLFPPSLNHLEPNLIVAMMEIQWLPAPQRVN